MARRVREHPWAATPLGAIEAWPAELRWAAAYVLDSALPAALVWGRELITLPNDGFQSILGDKPDALGGSFAAIWHEAWNQLEPLVQQALDGRATLIENQPLGVLRGSEAGPTCFTFSYTPVRSADGSVLGMINTVIETPSAHSWSAQVRESAASLREKEVWLAAQKEAFQAALDGAPLESSLGILVDAAVNPLRLVGAHVDITAQKETLEALAESEERLRQFGNASQGILWIRDAGTLQWQYLTPAFEVIYGMGRDAALAGDNYRGWLELIEPADRPAVAAAIERVRQGERVTFDYRIRRPLDGAVRWLRDTDFPIVGKDGKITLIGGIGEDITEAKLAQERIEQSEERLRSAVEVGRLGLWDWNIRTGQIHWSEEHFRMEGYAVGEVTPSYQAWTARIHPDDRGPAEAALQHAMDAHEEYVREFRTLHPDGSVRWLHGRGRFFYDSQAQPVRMMGAMIDVTARREWEERQKVWAAELQHRTRNLMGVIRSIADKTARSSNGLADFHARFRDRLNALTRVQSLLSRLNEHDRVTFDELIKSELSPINGSAERVTLDGPAGVRLRSSNVQILAMALHELATNAVKYGALGPLGGRLTVSWSFEACGPEAKPWLHIDWRESGVAMPPPGAAPRATGQGRELIELALPYQLKARTHYQLGPDGAHCTISVPVSETRSAGASLPTTSHNTP